MASFQCFFVLRLTLKDSRHPEVLKPAKLPEAQPLWGPESWPQPEELLLVGLPAVLLTVRHSLKAGLSKRPFEDFDFLGVLK